MSNPTLKRILTKTGNPDLLASLEKLSGSELNSLFMEVFRGRAFRQSVSEIKRAYSSNRFVLPSSVNPVAFLKMELLLLQQAELHGFRVMELSPLAPLGTCSAVALVDQNKIISALRNTEVVADATNVLALEASTNRIASGFDEKAEHYCASHRHTRAQSFSGKGFTAHFKIFCVVSSGKDTGNLEFEKESLSKHLSVYRDYFINDINLKDIKITIKSLTEKGKENLAAKKAYDHIVSSISDVELGFIEVPQEDHRYYRDLRFSIDLMHNGTTYNIGDGGFVDWAEKLTGNQKERMLTSGVGTELLFKLTSGMI